MSCKASGNPIESSRLYGIVDSSELPQIEPLAIANASS